MTLKEHFKATVIDEVAQLNGTDFEKMCKIVFSMIIKHEVEQKGHNHYLKPVKGAVDFMESDNLGVIGQSGTDKDYFTEKRLEKSKPIKDIDGSLINDPKCQVIYLFSNKRQNGAESIALREYIDNHYPQKIYVYDSERIANTIFENIESTNNMELVLADLPKSLEYYNILPKAHQVPSYNGKFCERNEYNDIIKLLNHNDVIQITGLSGIGKTEFAKCIAISQKKNYDAVLWIDGTHFDGNLNFVPILKDSKNINLVHFLSMSKMLIVVDNLCGHQSEFIENFISSNKKGSKCIITSLSQDITHKPVYSLPYLSDDISRDILTMGLDADKKPSEEQVQNILQHVKGYALLLKLIRTNVEFGGLAWEEVIDNLSDVTTMNDDGTNLKVAQRLIGKYFARFNEEFKLINSIESTQISKDFCDKNMNAFNIKALLNLSIIQSSQYFYSIHQIVFDSISNLMCKNDDKISAYKSLCNYLKNCTDKPIGFYDFMYRNRAFVNLALDSVEKDDKKIIAYSILQADDTYTRPQEYIEFIDKYLDEKSVGMYDLLLYIEKSEIDLFSKKKSPKYQEIAKCYAERLKSRYSSKLNVEMQKIIWHHTGKFYDRASLYDEAKICYNKILKKDKNAYYSLLQLGRVNKKLDDKCQVIDCINKILAIGEEHIPLPTLLSCYELISSAKYNELKMEYIIKRPRIFATKMLYAISIQSDQAFTTISLLSSYLQYNMPDIFSELIDALPLVIPHNENHDKAFAHGQLRLFQYKSFEDKKSEEANRVFQLAYDNFNLTPLRNDYERKRLSDLLLEAERYQDVLDMEKDFDDKNDIFFNMNRAKAYDALGNYDDAIKCIEISVTKGQSQTPIFYPALLHCKAQILYHLKKSACFDVMEEAIRNHSNGDVIRLWEAEIKEWKL